MYLCNELCSGGRPFGHLVFCPSVWLFIMFGKNFDVGHYLQTAQKYSFIHAMFLGTIELCCVFPLLS